jgi:hypothetical protein
LDPEGRLKDPCHSDGDRGKVDQLLEDDSHLLMSLLFRCGAVDGSSSSAAVPSETFLRTRGEMSQVCGLKPVKGHPQSNLNRDNFHAGDEKNQYIVFPQVNHRAERASSIEERWFTSPTGTALLPKPTSYTRLRQSRYVHLIIHPIQPTLITMLTR